MKEKPQSFTIIWLWILPFSWSSCVYFLAHIPKTFLFYFQYLHFPLPTYSSHHVMVFLSNFPFRGWCQECSPCKICIGFYFLFISLLIFYSCTFQSYTRFAPLHYLYWVTVITEYSFKSLPYHILLFSSGKKNKWALQSGSTEWSRLLLLPSKLHWNCIFYKFAAVASISYSDFFTHHGVGGVWYRS